MFFVGSLHKWKKFSFLTYPLSSYTQFQEGFWECLSWAPGYDLASNISLLSCFGFLWKCLLHSCLQVACICCYISTTSDHSRLQWIQYIATDAFQVCPCLCCSLWHQQCMKSSSIVSTYELQVSLLWLESWYLHWICFNQSDLPALFATLSYISCVSINLPKNATNK